MKIAKKITSILCDDVRREADNKYSLMGIYEKHMIFGDLPAVLPKLCLSIRLEDVATAFQECKITFKAPETDPIHLQVNTPEIPIGENISIFAMFSPFRAKRAGLAKFEVRFDDRKKPSHVHKFEIMKASDKKNSKKS